MKVFYGVFIMLCAHYLVHSQLTTISGITRPSVRDIGSTLSITCTVFYPSTFNFSWVKVDKKNYTNSVVLSNGNIILIDDSRLSARQDIIYTKYYESNCYTLKILNFQKADAGVYRCQVLDNLNVILSADTEVKVQIPPTIINVTKSLTVREGKPLKLECYASGVPIPSIIWTREDGIPLITGALSYNGNVLEFPAIKRSDHGLYYCDVSNGVGINSHQDIEVIVEFPPTVNIRKFSHLLSPIPYLELDCRVEGYPLPSVIWKHEEQEIINNTYTEITKVIYSEAVLNSILTIHISERHHGHYSCKGYNTMGSQEVTINIQRD